MTATFVWFHNHSDKPTDSAKFYKELLGWTARDDDARQRGPAVRRPGTPVTVPFRPRRTNGDSCMRSRSSAIPVAPSP